VGQARQEIKRWFDQGELRLMDYTKGNIRFSVQAEVMAVKMSWHLATAKPLMMPSRRVGDDGQTIRFGLAGARQK